MEERSDKDIAQMEVEQLNIEMKLERLQVSKAAGDIKEYVESNAAEDPLLKGVPEDKNPFKEKGGCIIS
ncbi:guanine nucleotide-binding protein G(I)/G(S)/G(O) subunit gamma-T2-like [Lethenteron reissneri]|uniref:guanine nucleotide-binding protein G(I)/G(S)/G(O) subunit gamma-T2-like n=1 Tax=Lethenteron reissneri TaxID=7753 RepID=UPI002AB6513E|nr:guanine nucleotide-binding protein G(I)/G(S)/G(O) subunit gamma-T2-like [Lethenteron reissneri]XP_061412736.1 guanine nucleotide-binding protein G(I)/G(S)/G(O) subunit gamma-T2-like [Lethenteron reissneri]